MLPSTLNVEQEGYDLQLSAVSGSTLSLVGSIDNSNVMSMTVSNGYSCTGTYVRDTGASTGTCQKGSNTTTLCAYSFACGSGSCTEGIVTSGGSSGGGSTGGGSSSNNGAGLLMLSPATLLAAMLIAMLAAARAQRQ